MSATNNYTVFNNECIRNGKTSGYFLEAIIVLYGHF